MKKSVLIIALLFCLLVGCGSNDSSTANDKYEIGHKDGYDAGYDAGYENGLEDGRSEANKENESQLSDKFFDGEYITWEEAERLIEYCFKYGYGYGYTQGEKHTNINWEEVDTGRMDARSFDRADDMFDALAEDILSS